MKLCKNEADAIDALLGWGDDEIETKDSVSTGIRSFYFSGKAYRISFTDYSSLHEGLYKSFAVEKVFLATETGVFFEKNYKDYLKDLDANKVAVSLYKNLKRIENRINAQWETPPLLYYKDGSPEMSLAFYWYINKYCIENQTRLIWKIDGEVVNFNDRKEFVNRLLTTDNRLRKVLLEIFLRVTSLNDGEMENAFFKGYDSSEIELSRLIYDETGLFIYITEDKFVNFGTTFIDDLHKNDSLIADRNDFIEGIKKDGPFWEKIRGTFVDYIDDYSGSFDGTY